MNSGISPITESMSTKNIQFIWNVASLDNGDHCMSFNISMRTSNQPNSDANLPITTQLIHVNNTFHACNLSLDSCIEVIVMDLWHI